MNRVNEILQTWTPPEVIEKYYSIGQTGYDKFGCPRNYTHPHRYHIIMLTQFSLLSDHFSSLDQRPRADRHSRHYAIDDEKGIDALHDLHHGEERAQHATEPGALLESEHLRRRRHGTFVNVANGLQTRYKLNNLYIIKFPINPVECAYYSPSFADQERNGQHLRGQLSGKPSTHFHHQRYN